MPTMKPEPRFQRETDERQSRRRRQATCDHTLCSVDVPTQRWRCNHCGYLMTAYESYLWHRGKFPVAQEGVAQ